MIKFLVMPAIFVSLKLMFNFEVSTILLGFGLPSNLPDRDVLVDFRIIKLLVLNKQFPSSMRMH